MLTGENLHFISPKIDIFRSALTAEEKVPIYQKMTLTIKEAAEYSNIGVNNIELMLKQPNCPVVLFVGTRKLVKRREFEKYIREKVVI